jgi:glycosyltransferase involved in cell wall biosynthesis
MVNVTMQREPGPGGGLRVLLACDWFVRYTVGLADGLRANGAHPILLTRSHEREFGSVPGAMRAYVGDALGEAVPHLRLGGRVRDPGAARELARVRRAVHRFAPHVVHLQDSLANDPRLFLASGARPGRYALTVHDLERHPGDRPANRRQRALWRWLVTGAGLIFVHGETLRERLIAEQRPRATVVAVPQGSGEPAPAPLPERPSLLLFGRLSWYKGIDTLLDAMPLVWEHAPEVRLTIAGEGEVARRPALEDERVVLRQGHVPDAVVPELFAAATCVVLPYREASQSAVAALAKRHGRGLIVTDVGALAEAAGDGSARVVPPEDPRALARAVLDVVAAPEVAANLGRAAIAAVRDELSWQRVAGTTLHAYRRVLLGDHAPAPRG